MLCTILAASNTQMSCGSIYFSQLSVITGMPDSSLVPIAEVTAVACGNAIPSGAPLGVSVEGTPHWGCSSAVGAGAGAGAAAEIGCCS